MRRVLRPGLALLLALAASPAGAVQPDEVLGDPALEARARNLSAELRCLVCQNQSIDDSDAPLARDLRVVVRERLRGGDTDGEVRDFLVRRYGEFILLKPPLGLHTLVLWLAPLALVGGAGAALALRARRHRRPDAAAPLSAAEREALARALDGRDAR